MNTQPTVALLVCMHNEAGYIERCLASIFAQDYPTERLEVWVMDGQSTDASWHIVEQLFEGRSNCHLLPNPRITQAAGWNLGIAQATSDIIGIVSAHAELAPDYVSIAVETLHRTGADMVGGLMRAYGQGYVGQALALATSTPFGVGGARFHYTDRAEEVDTVYMGLCWREVYQRIGGFDEEMVRDQDDELSYRLLAQGGRIFCNPAIRSRYNNKRSTFRALWQQYFQYGYWKIRVMQKHPRQMRLRHFVPPLFATALLGSALLAPFTLLGRPLLVLIAGSYALANLASSVWTAKGRRRYLPLLPVVFTALHLSYGFGFLIGLMKFANRWRDRQVNLQTFALNTNLTSDMDRQGNAHAPWGTKSHEMGDGLPPANASR